MLSPIQQSTNNAALTGGQVADNVAMAVAVKSQQAYREEGAAAIELLDAAAEAVNGGTAGDPLVAKATGLGRQLDVRA